MIKLGDKIKVSNANIKGEVIGILKGTPIAIRDDSGKTIDVSNEKVDKIGWIKAKINRVFT